MEKEEWKSFRNALDKKIERSLIKCLTFLDFTFQPALIAVQYVRETPSNTDFYTVTSFQTAN
jgi:hypothetical protein